MLQDWQKGMMNSFETMKFPGFTEPDIHQFTHEAMATIFSLHISSDDREYAAQAAAAAWGECDRLEANLSKFIENSDIARINHLSAGGSTIIGDDARECLFVSGKMTAITGGIFDITAGTCKPDDNKPCFFFDPDNNSVTRNNSTAQIDLGGFAKGWAVDKIAELLADWGITSALINGGYSSVLGLDPPANINWWPVTITHPQTKEIIKHVRLNNQCLSGSGLAKGYHIWNPHTGAQVFKRVAAWALSPGAAEGDALSTAFMIMTEDDIKLFCQERHGYGALVIDELGNVASMMFC